MDQQTDPSRAGKKSIHSTHTRSEPHMHRPSHTTEQHKDGDRSVMERWNGEKEERGTDEKKYQPAATNIDDLGTPMQRNGAEEGGNQPGTIVRLRKIDERGNLCIR